MMSWEHAWDLCLDSTRAEGGQGEVRKVQRRSDGVVGALKLLHDEHQEKKERRYRAQQEANALQLLDGAGTPKLLDGNTDHWADKNIPLYIVVEWIEGKTLAQRVNGKPLPLDTALQIARRLTEIVSNCHRAGIHHRDLKPNNVMLQGSDEVPILVDFGMSWTRPAEDQSHEFKTHQGQEIGNRFLRLAENLPGHHTHEDCADVTCLVGLLLYMISGEQPRTLLDGQGKMPHEFHHGHIPQETLKDRRWEQLRRLFNVGFQWVPEHRFQTTHELLARLENLEPSQSSDADELLQQEIGAFADFRKSGAVQARMRFQASLETASRRFDRLINEQCRVADVLVAVGGPNAVDDGSTWEASYEIYLKGTEKPRAFCRHRVGIQGALYVCSVALNDGWQEYFRGPLGDVDALAEAADRQAAVALTSMLQTLRNKIDG